MFHYIVSLRHPRALLKVAENLNSSCNIHFPSRLPGSASFFAIHGPLLRYFRKIQFTSITFFKRQKNKVDTISSCFSFARNTIFVIPEASGNMAFEVSSVHTETVIYLTQRSSINLAICKNENWERGIKYLFSVKVNELTAFSVWSYLEASLEKNAFAFAAFHLTCRGAPNCMSVKNC